jgi:hypothetical protein
MRLTSQPSVFKRAQARRNVAKNLEPARGVVPQAEGQPPKLIESRKAHSISGGTFCGLGARCSEYPLERVGPVFDRDGPALFDHQLMRRD